MRALAAAAALATSSPIAAGDPSARRLQGAQMIGGRPPREVEMALCDIGTVFVSGALSLPSHLCPPPRSLTSN